MKADAVMAKQFFFVVSAISLAVLFYGASVRAEQTTDLSYLNTLPQARAACGAKAGPLWNTGVTATILEGNAVYQQCLLDIIEQLGARYYAREDQTAADIRLQAEKTAEKYGEMQWVIWNERKDCFPRCGTIYHLSPGARTQTMLEDLIIAMAESIDVAGEVTTDEWRDLFRNGKPNRDDSPDWLITPANAGPITIHTTDENLFQMFGPENILDDVGIYIGEGIYEAGSFVYPGDPEKRIAVRWWWDKDKGHWRPDSVFIRGDKSRWRTAEGVTLGTTLKELEALNGGPFSLYGFGWDYGGALIGFEGGKLEDSLRNLALRFDGSSIPYDEMDPGKLAGITGDRPLSSSHPVLQEINPAINEMILMFREE